MFVKTNIKMMKIISVTTHKNVFIMQKQSKFN